MENRARERWLEQSPGLLHGRRSCGRRLWQSCAWPWSSLLVRRVSASGLDYRKVDFRAGAVVVVVGEDVDGDSREDLRDLAILVTRLAEGVHRGRCDHTALTDHFDCELQGGGSLWVSD